MPLAVHEMPESAPRIIFAAQPNPLRTQTVITCEVGLFSCVEAGIYDISGRQVAALVSYRQQSGVHQFRWDASGLPAGVYYCRLLRPAVPASIQLLRVN